MNNFNFDDKSKDRENSSRKNFTNRDSRRPIMHSAVCDECGKECQVPFKPTSGKPIYCSECFEKKGGRSSNRSDRRHSYRRNYKDRASGRYRENKTNDLTIKLLVEKVENLNNKLNTVIDLLTEIGSKKSKSHKVEKVKNKKLKK